MELWNDEIPLHAQTGTKFFLDLSFVENEPYVSKKLRDKIHIIWKLPKEIDRNSIMPLCVDKWQTRSCCRWLWCVPEIIYPGI